MVGKIFVAIWVVVLSISVFSSFIAGSISLNFELGTKKEKLFDKISNISGLVAMGMCAISALVLLIGLCIKFIVEY